MAVRMYDDPRWGEAREETGKCLVLDIKHEPGALNAQVTLKATHVATMIEPVTAWVATNEEPFQRVLWGYENRAELWYRIVTHRRKAVDKATPFEQLTKRERIRDLVEIRKAQDDPREQGGNALPAGTRGAIAARQEPATAPLALPAGEPTDDGIVDAVIVDDQGNPIPDEPANTIPAAASIGGDVFSQTNVLNMRALRTALQQPDIDQALVDDLETKLLDGGVPLEEIARATGRHLADVAVGGGHATRTQGQTVAAEALARAADPQQLRDQAPPVPDLDSAAVPPPAAETRPVSAVSGLSRRQGSQPVASDSKPWEYSNTDGSPNLSSYAAQGTMDFVNLAARLIVSRLRQRAAEDPAFVIPPPAAKDVTALAKTLLHCADLAQTSLHEGARRDRMASSYKLARQAVRESIDLYPVPWDSSSEERAAWKADVVAHASLLVGVGYQLLQP